MSLTDTKTESNAQVNYCEDCRHCKKDWFPLYTNREKLHFSKCMLEPHEEDGTDLVQRSKKKSQFYYCSTVRTYLHVGPACPKFSPKPLAKPPIYTRILSLVGEWL